MSPMLRYLAMPLLVTLAMLGGLILATDGRLDRHFHGSIADRSPQASIHVVVIDSGFQLRQFIDTRDLDHVRTRLKEAPLCVWLRVEYDRGSDWTTSGTVQLRLSTPERSWITTFKSEQITTYFQPFCFEASRAGDVIDQPTHLDISVVEPGLKQVAIIALGPANGRNNAEINGQVSDFTTPHILTADPGPSGADLARFVLIGLFSLAQVLVVLIVLTGPKTRAANSTTSTQPQEGNHP